MQKIAMGAVQDGLEHHEVKKLASLGSTGVNPQNCQRDLLQWLKTSMAELPEPLAMELPVQNCREEVPEVKQLQVPYLPLHRMLRFMCQNTPAVFEERVTGGTGELRQFWDTVSSSNDPRWKLWGPILQKRANWKDRCVPLALHGDGVPVFKGKSMNVLSANSLLGRGSTLDIKVMMCCYWSHLRHKSQTAEMDTEQAMWKYIMWDLNATFSGVFPGTDPLGNQWQQGSQAHELAFQPLMNGYWGIPWLLKGDLEYMALYMGLNHYSSLKPCFLCKADKAALNFANLGPEAPWRNTAWKAAEWREAHPDCHPLFRFLGCSVHTVHCDILHTVSLGVAQQVAGNVLFYMIWHIFQGPFKRRLQKVWVEIEDFYNSTPGAQRIRRLTWAMFLPQVTAPKKHYPVISKLKAKETEWLARALQWVWAQYTDKEDDVQVHITLVLNYLVEIYDHCTSAGLFFTAEQALSFQQACNNLMVHWQHLSRWALNSGFKLFNITPKWHYLAHVAEQALYLHPRCGWTFSDESFVGKVALLARASTGGIAVDTLCDIIAKKYTRGMYIRWLSGQDCAGTA